MWLWHTRHPFTVLSRAEKSLSAALLPEGQQAETGGRRGLLLSEASCRKVKSKPFSWQTYFFESSFMRNDCWHLTPPPLTHTHFGVRVCVCVVHYYILCHYHSTSTVQSVSSHDNNVSFRPDIDRTNTWVLKKGFKSDELSLSQTNEQPGNTTIRFLFITSPLKRLWNTAPVWSLAGLHQMATCSFRCSWMWNF